MEGFIALVVFAQQMSDSQKKLPTTRQKQDRPSSNRVELALLNDAGLSQEANRPPSPVEK
jgi:hypothetical protein